MNCEQVEERLSAYLDNMLAPEERRALALHLQGCPRCMMLLAELRQNDILLARLPRVNPSPTLHERIFSAPEFVELVRMFPDRVASHGRQVQPWTQTQPVRGYPGFLAPAPLQDRFAPQTPATNMLPAPTPFLLRASPLAHSPRKQARFTLLKWALAAVLVMALGTAALLSLSFRQPASTRVSGAITPPAAGPQAGQEMPLAAGMRFVFLRDGALWSVLIDGGAHQPERLTPAGVTVAAGWVVSPPARGHAAGDMLAYVDLKGGRVHTIRSDGQQDILVPQALFKGAASAAGWAGDTGNTILNNLAWSPDGSTLAFVGSPAGDGQTHLYLYSLDTNTVREISTGFTGSASHLVWSPDGTRLAFTATNDGAINVLDYNAQNREVLNLSNLAAAQGTSANQVLTLDWSSNAGGPAVTWSLGSIGHISSLWLHHVGVAGTIYPQLLLSGDYLQALYSPGGDHGVGCWLLVTTIAGRAGDVWRISLAPGARLLPLSQGRQVSLARWSPDGSAVFYLDGQNNGVGNGHLVNPATGSDRLLSGDMAANPAPAWSNDGQQLAYSAGSTLTLVNTINGSQTAHIQLSGKITGLTWSPDIAHQLIVALGGPTSGLYLVDTQRNTSLQLDHPGVASAIQWTEIP